MKIVAAIFTFLWTTVWIFIGVNSLLDTSKQIERDRNFAQTQIKPSVDFVNNFKKSYNKLPTNREVYTWERDHYKDYSSDLNQRDDSLISGFGPVNYIRKSSDVISNDQSRFTNANWKKDFAIGVWRGEWMEYYYSWNDSYETNNYSWSDGFISLFVFTTIGLVPFVFWFYFYERNKKSSTQHWFGKKPADGIH